MIDFLSGITTEAEPQGRTRPEGYRDSQRVLMERKRAAERDITDIPDRLNPSRWESCSLDLQLFLETYLSEQFCKAWSEAHLRCIAKMQYAILNGGYFALAMPRGEGKTTIAKGAALWALLYGHRRYIVLIAATERKAVLLLGSVKKILRFNTTLLEDFPEVIIPVRDLQGKGSRSSSQTVHGEPTGMIWKTDQVVLPRVDGSDSCESRLEIAGITGDIRGRNATLMDGTEIRPDFAIGDDPQTHGSAKSPSQCDDREEILRTDVLGLAGPGEKLAMVIPCTVIKKGDLADRLLDNELNPDFRGEKTAAIVSWPDNLEEDPDKEGITWDDYNEARIEGLHAEDEGKAANEFYIKHCFDLEQGAKVGWEGRRVEGDQSALQSIMNQYYAMGKEAFYSEYQNSPIEHDESIYDLTPQTVCSRLNNFKRMEVPKEATMLVSMADINYVGINVTVTAFQNDFTGFIVDHFKYPEGEKNVLIKKNTPENEVAKIVARAVIDVEKLLETKGYTQSGEEIKIDLKLFDGNFWTDHVFSALRAIRKKNVLADRGTAAKKYRVPVQKGKVIGRPYHKAHKEKGPKGWQIRHDSDFWRMATQKAFLLKPGQPGSLSLWGNDPNRHRAYAHEICCEKLINFVPAEPNDLYQWHMIPGQANDQLDSTVGCYVAAASLGASLDGVKRTRKKRPKPQPNRGSSKNGRSGGIRTRY